MVWGFVHAAWFGGVWSDRNDAAFEDGLAIVDCPVTTCNIYTRNYTSERLSHGSTQPVINKPL